jgi:hypothetical protein
LQLSAAKNQKRAKLKIEKMKEERNKMVWQTRRPNIKKKQ